MGAPGLQFGAANIAPRLGAEQKDILMAFGDIGRNMVNILTSLIAPITLPKWDHIAQR